ncbi:MAG TPA: LysR family transcriptional regulator [Polyangiaceae bacterium]|nr:LysR family transcriptional regulator [Polyangiaceae bacterium]
MRRDGLEENPLSAGWLLKYFFKMRLDQLSGLLAFVTVAERRGFSAAARTLGVSPSALSQSVRGLEARVGTSLLVRTTRTVGLTEAGERLLRRCGPGLREAIAAVDEAGANEGEVTGRLRLTVPGISLPFVEPVVVRLRDEHAKLTLEVIVDDKFVDLVTEGYDAGVRLVESTERDMVAVRVAPPFRFVVVGAPAYLKQRGRPEHPRDLHNHDCIGFRAMTTGALYVWEFERRGRELKVPVTGPIVTNDAALMVRTAALGLGLAYVADFSAADALRSKALDSVLDDYMPSAPGMFLYFPGRSKEQPKMQALLGAIRAIKT